MIRIYKLLVCALFIISLGQAQGNERQPLNVLFIAVD